MDSFRPDYQLRVLAVGTDPKLIAAFIPSRHAVFSVGGTLPEIGRDEYDVAVVHLASDDLARFVERLHELDPALEIVALIPRERRGFEDLHPGVSAYLDWPAEPTHIGETVNRLGERARLLRALHREQERYKHLVEDAPVGVFELRDGRFSYVNRYLCELSGYSERDIIGSSPLDFLVPKDRERLKRRLTERLSGRLRGGYAAYTFRKRDGTPFQVQVQSHLVEMDEGTVIVGTLRDLTPERRLVKLQRTVLELGEAILTEEGIDRILQQVLDAITEHSGFRRAVASLYDLSAPDPMKAEVYKIFASGLSPEEVRQLEGEGGMTPAERAAAFSPRFQLGPAYYIPHDMVPWRADLGLAGTVSVVGWHKDDFLFIPLKGARGIIGHISVDDPVDRAAPTVASIEPVAALANFAALAIERAYQMWQLKRQKERLHGMASFGSRLAQFRDLGSLCRAAVQRLRDDMGYDLCGVWLKEGENLRLHGIASIDALSPADLPNRGESVPAAGLLQSVVEQKKPVVVRDPVPRALIPILGRKGTLGILEARIPREATFGEQDLEILTSLASGLSVVISDLNREQALRRIYRLGQELTKAVQIEALIDGTLSFLAEQFNFQHSAVLLLEGEDLVVRGIRNPGGGRNLTPGQRFSFSQGLVGWAATHRESLLVSDVEDDPRYVVGFSGTRSELVVPMQIGDELIGVLNVESPQPGSFAAEDQLLLEAVAAEVAIAISNLNSQERLRQQAIHDPLTSLYNRHYFNEMISSELARANRYKHPLSFLMIDVDGFRAVNNRLGHLKGDAVLRAVAGFLQDNVRGSDRVIRYGGDEFLIVMPETDEEADPVAARLKEKIDELSERLELGELKIGLSVGIYIRHPGDPLPLKEILREVDHRMYAEKRRAHPGRSDEYRY